MTSRIPSLVSALGLGLAVLAGCAPKQAPAPEAPAPAPTAAADRLPNQDKLAQFFRGKVNLPPNVPMQVGNVKDSVAFGGLKEGTIEVGEGPQKRTIPFVATADGRWVMFGTPQDITVDPKQEILAKIKLEGQPFRGAADAKVTIVEYSDFQCPYCKRGYDVIEQQVLKEYGDKVKFYYKHYPLPFHPWAEPAAVAVECAREQSVDAYWATYHGFFERQNDVKEPANVKAVAKDILAKTKTKIDMKAWQECYDGQKTLAAVKAQAEEGASVGVNGTPAYFINGQSLEGAQPFEAFKGVIDAALAPSK
ncbi:MAG: thioredoxin domain-containing protein [Deltaproteobacteria bacterium]|nr:thioredoxin domain-containing protein [Deltaproteobacteria bacterium]